MAASAPLYAPLESVNLLLVDDDLNVRQVLGTLFESYGADIRAVSSGEAALAAMRNKLPDCLVVDLKMPGMDGYELRRRVGEIERALDVRIPSIAITGDASIANYASALRVGFSLCLAKPVKVARLVDVISQLLDAE
jgi:CheY-like chemotaxis protein